MWLTVKEVSRVYKLKKSTIYLWASRGQIPHYKIGQLIRFESEELDEWMRGFRQSGRSVKVSNTRRTRTTSNLDIDKTIRKAIDDAKGFKV
jgi:excisionase family DNA binding protein